MNPDDDEDIPAPVCETIEHEHESRPPTITIDVPDKDDEKGNGTISLEMENVYTQCGQALFISTKPKTVRETSLPLLADPADELLDSDEQTAIEISSTPLAPDEQTLDTIANTCLRID